MLLMAMFDPKLTASGVPDLPGVVSAFGRKEAGAVKAAPTTTIRQSTMSVGGGRMACNHSCRSPCDPGKGCQRTHRRQCQKAYSRCNVAVAR